ncbi:Ig-like group 1 domain-containing protein [Pseudoduganella sp. DS3]|uniref:Ig-like group 1 domain-containing protein n=1 Tax=Pseudoduganella guangdongensis TaxID=2692179 RepID=A0A6N9HI92_9BURK|nr:Ig-like domain-containing protein [Pseudoduganella guangdongensis]MYN02813.1 Ig-like group 1 domain-containing protein [Pseudoduganella guangdongensis]
MSNVLSKLSGWVGALACASLLAACGGGGGSPGSTPGNPDPTAPTAASIVVTASADTIASSGQAGTEVTLTAIVKDGNSRAVPNAKVVFKASSGSISTSTAVTDANGVVTEKLSTQGDPSLRDIKISASVNGVTSNEIVVKVVAATQTLTLTANSGTLNSAGAEGAEVELTALVKDSKSMVMQGVRVDLSADSGSLSISNPVTNEKGIVSAKLNTGGDATSRTIRVTASLPGVTPVVATVVVAGTKLTVNANSTVSLKSTSDVTVNLVDSAGVALRGKPVTFSSSGNSLTVKGGGPAVTNSAGQLILSFLANAGTSDTITVSAQGETSTAIIAISATNFTVRGAAGDVADINTCVPVAVRTDNINDRFGVVVVGSSRGSVFTNAQCTIPMTNGVSLNNGDAVVYVQSSSPGVATLTANIVNSTTTQGSLEFVAPLLASSNIIVQADPAVVAANNANSSIQQATIRAVVRDGTPANNLVKNARVSFSIVSDASGGYLTQPSLVTTGADGSATVSYVAGTSATPLNGVVIRAQLQGASTASSTANLTVSRKSLSITAGTGNVIGVDGPTRYRKDYTVIVSDASGNAVPGVTVTASVVPRYYYKGTLEYLGSDGPWQLPNGTGLKPTPWGCPNEDLNRDGFINPGEDVNRNGTLEPGIPVTVTTGGTTDANGTAIVTLTYPRDRANWLAVDLTIRGAVQGSEAVYQAYIPRLIGLVSDYSDRKVIPPGYTSPYGTNNSGAYADCLDPN